MPRLSGPRRRASSPKPKTLDPRVYPALRDLHRLQTEAKLTDDALGDKAGYSGAVLYSWRNFKNRNPGLLALTDFAQVFGYEVRLVPKEKKNEELP